MRQAMFQQTLFSILPPLPNSVPKRPTLDQPASFTKLLVPYMREINLRPSWFHTVGNRDNRRFN